MRIAQAGMAGSKSQIKVSRTETSRATTIVADASRKELATTLHVGNCIEVLATLPDRSVDLVFADPPYNLQLEAALSRPDQSLVDAVDDDWDKFANFADYDAFSRAWLRAVRRVMKPNATLFVIGSYHNIFRVGATLQDEGFWILNDIIWRKANPMPNFRGRRFTNAHETLIWASLGPDAKRYTFNYESLKAANEDLQMRSDWHFPICTGAERLKNTDGRKTHPTQKPEALLARVLLSATKPGDVVLDPFMGSGTTGAVAKRLQRRFIGIEQDGNYAAAAARRIEAVEAIEAGLLIDAASKRAEARVSFASLVEANLIAVGDELRDPMHRHRVKVCANGLVAHDGVAGSIHKMAALLQGLPACNGWTYWYRDLATGPQLIDDVRTTFRSLYRPV